MRIRFLGAAREVTGSCFRVDADGVSFLVDCGLFQGGREAPAKNRAFPAFDPATLDFALVTHAHLDHCGLLPRLCARAPRLPVYATKPTADLMPVMLRDSAHIQGREAAHGGKRGSRRPAEPRPPPLYGMAEVDRAMRQVHAIPYRVEFRPHPLVRVRFLDAGHILGSSILEVKVRQGGRERRLVFSGDLGQPARPVVHDPDPAPPADVLVMEATYGNRLHKSMEATVAELVSAVRETVVTGRGNLVVPAFALGRTQDLLVLLDGLCGRGELPPLNVFVDSPLAHEATAVTLLHQESLDEAARGFASRLRSGRLPYSLRFPATPEESRALARIRAGAVLIAASGMCDAGRVRHHLRSNLPREDCAVLFTGFQAAGTLGRRLVDGARAVRLFGESVAVRARILTLGGLSAHADQRTLLEWATDLRKSPSRVFVVHAEEQSACLFAAALESARGWSVTVPRPGESFAC
jgi:metallo-beta-lactamase family protein